MGKNFITKDPSINSSPKNEGDTAFIVLVNPSFVLYPKNSIKDLFPKDKELLTEICGEGRGIAPTLPIESVKSEVSFPVKFIRVGSKVFLKLSKDIAVFFVLNNK